MEQHDHDQKEWLDADLTGSYDVLSRSASDHLAAIFPSTNRVVIICLYTVLCSTFKGLLKLYSASKGLIKLNDFFLEFSDTASKGHYDKGFVMDFPYKNVEVRVNQEELSPILYTTGYVPCCCCLPSETYGRNGATPIFRSFFFFTELPVPPQAAGVVGTFNVLDIYPSEHYGLSFFWTLRMPFFTRSPFKKKNFLYTFPFCKYTLHVCYVFNVNLTDSFDDRRSQCRLIE